MNQCFDIIQRRKSVRTYNHELIMPQKIKILKDYCTNIEIGPFGNQLRLEVVDASECSTQELKEFVSYGNIRGARYFLAGAVEKGQYGMEDYGYAFEGAILKATELGISTVWLGGSLNRSLFGKKLNLKQEEVIPAISPIGYPAEKPSMVERIIRFGSSGKRKDFEEIFTIDNLKPLGMKEAGRYGEILEAVRLAPSARNKQPWRVNCDLDQGDFHFYIKTDLTNTEIQGIRMQKVDMGIAMYHFAVMAEELGVPGGWEIMKEPVNYPDREYLVSWRATGGKIS